MITAAAAEWDGGILINYQTRKFIACAAALQTAAGTLEEVKKVEDVRGIDDAPLETA